MFGGEHRRQDGAFTRLRRCGFELAPLVELIENELVGHISRAYTYAIN